MAELTELLRNPLQFVAYECWRIELVEIGLLQVKP